MPPSKPQKYTPPAPTTNSYWDQFLPPQPVAPKPQPKPQPVADVLRPVVQAPQPQPQPNQWLPIIAPQPQQIQGPQPQPQQPANPWLPLPPPQQQGPQPNPLNNAPQPQQWNPQLIQTGFTPPNIGAPQMVQSNTFSPTVQSGLNNFNQAPIQGPQPRPGYLQDELPLTNQAYPWPAPLNTETGARQSNVDEFRKSFSQPGQTFSERIGQGGDNVTGLTGMQPFSESAAYRQMQYYNQQLDEKRPYGTAGVWDMWQGIQEGAGQIGQGFVDAFNNPSTNPQDKLAGLGQLGANIVGGALKIADAPRDTAIGYAATAPLVAAVNASQATQRYVATRAPDKNTVGEYVSSYAGAWFDSFANEFLLPMKATSNQMLGTQFDTSPTADPNAEAQKTLAQFTNAGTLTPAEQQKLAAIDPLLPAKVQQDVKLNYGTVQSQQDTRDQLVGIYTAPTNYEADAAKFMAQAATTKDKGEKDNLLEQAALAGYKAYKAKNTNPYEVVDNNTSWQQLGLEVLAPDPLFDGVGALFKGLGMLGEPMTKLFGSAKERRMLNSAEDFLKVMPEQIAVDIEKLGLSPNITQVFEPHSKIFTWTSGTQKAQQDSYNLSKAVIGLLSDVDNVHDARILLNTMTDSKMLAKAIREGIPYQMLDSTLLRSLADEKGMVHLGFAQFASKDVQNALKTWGNTAKEFLQDAESLKKAQLDKTLFAAEFIDTLREAGYARYSVAKEIGKGAQTNYANVVSSMMQRTMSTFQIKLNPGSWVRDVAATAGLAMGDGLAVSIGDFRKSLNAMYGNVLPSMLVEGEKLAGATMTEQRSLGKGIFSRIPKPSAKYEEAMANNIFAKSTLDMTQKYIPKALNVSLSPLLKEAGMDQRTINAINNQLSHVMRTEGKARMVEEFNKVVSGISKPFDLKQYAGQIDNLLTVDELDGIYKAVQTAKSPEEFQKALDLIVDSAEKRYTNMVIESPTMPQRYDWTDIELTQDAGDFSQTAETARRYGLNPTEAEAAVKESVALVEKEKGLLDTLTQFVTDSQDPNARYALYNVWAQRQDLLVSARVRISEMAEDVIARGGQDLWASDYYPAVRDLWKETRGKIEAVINDGKRLMNEGADLSQNYGAWGQLERAARTDEGKAMASLMLEPQSAKYDGGMMKEVMAAKRAIDDKAAARAYAAARRVIGENTAATSDVMDVLLSADRDVHLAGSKVRAYLDQQLQRLMGENGKISSKGWDQYHSLRNAKWREHTEYSVVRWKAAETQTVLHGKGTGITWADPFTASVAGANGTYNDTLELIGQSSTPGNWWVRKPDGSHILMPGPTVKTAKPRVPKEAVDAFKKGTDASELVTSDELDNIMSGFSLFDNATSVDFAKAEVESAKIARDSMRAEWDRVAKGNYGLPGLDQMIANYKRNGVVNTGEAKKFQDLYGNVIGGMKIDNADDLNRFLTSYSGLSEKVKVNKSVKLEKEVLNMDEMPSLFQFNDPNYVPPKGWTKDKVEEVVGKFEQTLIEQSEKVAAAGVTVAPHSGNMASQGVEEVNRLRQQLMNLYQDYTQMTPNKVSEAVQLQLYQAFRQQAVPAIDNVLKASADYGDKMRSFVVPDRMGKTRVDELLALVMPYHFWFTRTAKNSVERMIYEPGTFRRLNQLQQNLPQMAADAQGIEQDPNMPTRYEGAVPMVIGGKTYYMYLDLGQFMPNMVSMLGNKFASPDSSEGGLQYALESMQSLGFGMYPFLNDAVGVMSGAKKTQDVRPLGYFPLGRTLAWEASNYFGLENMPTALRAGNEEYLVGRQVSNMAQRGDVTPEEASFAMDYLRQMYGGDKPLPEQQRLVPDERMQAIIQQAVQAATLENRNKYLTSMSGVSVAPYDNTESKILGAQDQYFGSQYGPNNQFGGKTATSEILRENPGLQSRWGQKAITNEDVQRPGIGAAKTSMYSDQKELKDSLTQSGSDSVDAAIKANPSITKKEMYSARVNGMLTYAASVVGGDVLKQWLAQNPDATTGDISKFVTDSVLSKNYPSVYNQNPTYTPNQFADAGMNASERSLLLQDGGKLPTAGMNPVEQGDYNQKQAVDYATYNYPGKPEYVKGDKSYNNKLSTWEAERTDWLSTELGVSKDEASTLIGDTANANKTDAEIQRGEDIDAEFARREAEWQNKRINITGEFGEGAGAVWDGYYAIDKAQRKAYMLEHPEMKAYNMAAWNPNEYAQAKTIFGDTAWMEWANVPAYADTDEAKAARNAYWMEHPTAKVLNAWVNGRPANYDESKADDAIKYNFGADYAEAMTLYGDNIWDLFKQYNPGWNKAQKSAFYRANGMYGDFTDWWYGNEKKESTGRSGGRSGGGGGGGGGGGYSRTQTAAVNQDRFPQIYSQGLAQGLANTGSPQAWRPSWIQSGNSRIGPDQMKPWRAINVKNIAGG